MALVVGARVPTRGGRLVRVGRRAVMAGMATTRVLVRAAGLAGTVVDGGRRLPTLGPDLRKAGEQAGLATQEGGHEEEVDEPNHGRELTGLGRRGEGVGRRLAGGAHVWRREGSVASLIVGGGGSPVVDGGWRDRVQSGPPSAPPPS